MTKNSDTPLLEAKKFLDTDYDTHHIPGNDETPFETLFVGLGPDDKDRDLVISLNFINDMTNSLGVDDDIDDAYFLQFFLLFPFQIPQAKLEEVSLAALKLSRILPIGALGVVEETGACYLQYNLACPSRDIDEVVLKESVDIIAFFGGDFSQKLEEIATGSKKRSEIFEELKQNGVEFPPIAPPSAS